MKMVWRLFVFFFFVERELREGDEGINNIRRPKIGEERERERERWVW